MNNANRLTSAELNKKKHLYHELIITILAAVSFVILLFWVVNLLEWNPNTALKIIEGLLVVVGVVGLVGYKYNDVVKRFKTQSHKDFITPANSDDLIELNALSEKYDYVRVVLAQRIFECDFIPREDVRVIQKAVDMFESKHSECQQTYQYERLKKAVLPIPKVIKMP